MAGIVVGSVLTVTGAHWIQAFLYGVSASDPRTIAGTSLVLLVIALLAGWSSAHRAAAIDPVVTLGAE
jgi:ABC-type lipoprotein release transport system permease subunit